MKMDSLLNIAVNRIIQLKLTDVDFLPTDVKDKVLEKYFWYIMKNIYLRFVHDVHDNNSFLINFRGKYPRDEKEKRKAYHFTKELFTMLDINKPWEAKNMLFILDVCIEFQFNETKIISGLLYFLKPVIKSEHELQLNERELRRSFCTQFPRVRNLLRKYDYQKRWKLLAINTGYVDRLHSHGYDLGKACLNERRRLFLRGNTVILKVIGTNYLRSYECFDFYYKLVDIHYCQMFGIDEIRIRDNTVYFHVDTESG